MVHLILDEKLKAFDKVDVIDVGCHELPSGFGTFGGGFTKLVRFCETFFNLLSNRVADMFGKISERTRLQRMVGMTDRGIDLSGRFDSGVGSAFAFAVTPNQGFEKPLFREVLRCRSFLCDGRRPLEGVDDLCFKFGFHPLQERIALAGLECRLCLLNHRTVDRVAMRMERNGKEWDSCGSGSRDECSFQ